MYADKLTYFLLFPQSFKEVNSSFLILVYFMFDAAFPLANTTLV